MVWSLALGVRVVDVAKAKVSCLCWCKYWIVDTATRNVTWPAASYAQQHARRDHTPLLVVWTRPGRHFVWELDDPSGLLIVYVSVNPQITYSRKTWWTCSTVTYCVCLRTTRWSTTSIMDCHGHRYFYVWLCVVYGTVVIFYQHAVLSNTY